ncbi:MAG TPA: hypothetical protein VGF71_05865 [Caulobacteraceae bacterium]|jgi:hypothetical protein
MRAFAAIAGIAAALALGALSAGASFAQAAGADRYANVQALHDPELAGDVPAVYSPGFKTRAQRLQALMADELAFYRARLDMNVSLSLAVLDPEQWRHAEAQIPYPMPSVDGVRPVALLPADPDLAPEFLPQKKDASARVLAAVAAHGLSWHDAAVEGMDLIAGHELGHTLNKTYGIAPGTHWLNEFMASYALYAWLAGAHPKKLWLVKDLVTVGPNHRQPHVSLDEFETRYDEILSAPGGDNYGWYQRQFIGLVEIIYPRQGLSLFAKMRAAFPGGSYAYAQLGEGESLKRLDTIDPAFRVWTETMARQPSGR